RAPPHHLRGDVVGPRGLAADLSEPLGLVEPLERAEHPCQPGRDGGPEVLLTHLVEYLESLTEFALRGDDIAAEQLQDPHPIGPRGSSDEAEAKLLSDGRRPPDELSALIRPPVHRVEDAEEAKDER